MRRLFPDPLAVAPAIAMSADCGMTGLKAGTYAPTPHESCHPDWQYKCRLCTVIVNSAVVPSTPGQSRPGRSQLPAMLGRQPVTGRFWRQEAPAPALSAVVRE